MLNELENLHFDKEQDIHMNSKNYKKNDCGHYFKLAIVVHNYMFHILQEVGAEFKLSI